MRFYFSASHRSLQSWGRVTQAKYLLTRVSSMSFHLEPPKVFFTLYNAKEVQKVIRYNFLENNIQDMVHNPHVPQKEISKTRFLLRKLLNGQFLQVGQRRNSHATVPKTSPKVTSSTSLFSSMIYHVNHVFFFVSRQCSQFNSIQYNFSVTTPFTHLQYIAYIPQFMAQITIN